jgi:competence ComEA-like helix-hairpin-helix protein
MKHMGMRWGVALMLAGMLASARAERWEQPTGKWDTLVGCRLEKSNGNDGDSFYVRQGKNVFLFRLYAVDTPEDRGTYRERVEAQARHFGITPEQTIKAGVAAEQFTKKLLTGTTFAVGTCWQDAKGSSRMRRFYATVTVNGLDLAEQLAAAGWARVYGFMPPTPGFSEAKLRALERKAKAERRGVYAFSNPEGSLAPTPATLTTLVSPTPAASPEGKIDVNTATEEQLEAVPGIGPYFAKAIIAGRPYEKVEDIQNVNGIGTKTLAKLAPYFCVGGR